MDKHPFDDGWSKNGKDEMTLLYQLGLALASGKDLFTTLLTLQTEILKLVHADALYIAIHDETTDIVEFPIYFEVGVPEKHPSRVLSESPGLTGAVIQKGSTLYLPDMMIDEVVVQYSPIDDDNELVLHTFLGIPLIVNGKVIGMLSVQSRLVDAYTSDQIRLMENVGVQAALAIDKSRLLDQLKQELDDHKKMELDLRQRESILEAVTFAAEQFLKTADWRLNIDKVLERLGQTMHVTHAYLFEDHLDPSGHPVTSMRYEWTAPGYPSDLNGPYFQNSRIDEQGYEDQVETMRRGDVRAGNSQTFNSIEKEAMDSFGVKAILEVPIFANQQEWGAIGFDDFEQERNWTSAEVDALKVAGSILSAAIQRQEAESAVHESERMYRQAIEAAGAVPYYQDYELNRYTFMGEGIRAMTGYSPSEISPRVWDSMILSAERSGELAGLTEAEAIRVVREGIVKAWKCDYQIRARDEKIRWIADSAIELFGEGGISYGSIGIMQDITERKQVEANLRQRETILKIVAEAANTFLKVSEWNTQVWKSEVDVLLERLGTTINASHAYLFENEFTSDGQVRMSMRYEWTAAGFKSDLDNPKYTNMSLDTDYMESWNHHILNGLPYIGDAAHLTAEDMQEIHQRHMKAILDVPIIIDGEWLGTIGFDDMAISRLWTPAEVDALVVAANLLGAAIKRNQMDSILQKELEQRQTLIGELESKNEELERFTYTVSHDLKSPLVTISGFLGFLEQDATNGNSERLKQDMQRIHEAVTKMQRLLTELLELSRIGRMINPPQELSFNELVNEALDIVHGQLEEHNITVQVQPEMSTVIGDKPRLVEVLQNLLDNAAKYMGTQTHPQIEIGQRGDENGKPIFYVKDNGMGIAPEHHERIFGLFNKLDVKSEGTGVGLALVKRIIEVHSGRIWVESEVGKGSTFYFVVPVAKKN